MKDWARKPYQTKASYPEMIRQTPARAFWNSITEQQPVFSEYGAKGKKLTATERRYLQFLKQSEAKKPYLADDYQSMEYEWEGLPGLQDGNPHIDHPWMPDPQPTRIDKILPPEPGEWILYAFTEDFFCLDQTRTVTINGTHPIYEVEFTFPGLLAAGTDFVVTGGLGTPVVTIDLTVDALETQDPISMRVYMEAFDAPPLPSEQGRGFTGFSIQEGSISDCEIAFYISLNFAEGTPVTSAFVPNFRVYNSSSVLLAQTVTYQGWPGNTWKVVVPGPFDDNGYWVNYTAALSTYTTIRTQYPEIYKSSEAFDNADLIFPGNYSDIINILKINDPTTLPEEPTLGTPECPNTCPQTSDYVCIRQAAGSAAKGNVYFRAVDAAENALIRSYNIESSVEYDIYWQWPGTDIENSYVRPNSPGCSGIDPGACSGSYPWNGSLICGAVLSSGLTLDEFGNPETPSCTLTLDPWKVTFKDSDGSFETAYEGLNPADYPNAGIELSDLQGAKQIPAGLTPTYTELSPNPLGKEHSFSIELTNVPLTSPGACCIGSIGFRYIYHCTTVVYSHTRVNNYVSDDWDGPYFFLTTSWTPIV